MRYLFLLMVGCSNSGLGEPLDTDPGGLEDTGGLSQPEITGPPQSEGTSESPTGLGCNTFVVTGYALCAETETTCEVVYENGEGCNALCAIAGLSCVGAFDNLDDQCAADLDRPLACDTGHQSDYCLCGF